MAHYAKCPHCGKVYDGLAMDSMWVAMHGECTRCRELKNRDRLHAIIASTQDVGGAA